MKPYWRSAIELYPTFRKEKVPIARFACSSEGATFSLLPVQLIPYHQYTVQTVIGTLLLAFKYREAGQQGFYGASVEVDPDSEVTPWLVVCWLAVVLKGLRRGHAELGRLYDLAEVRAARGMSAACSEVAGYFLAFGWSRKAQWEAVVLAVLRRYSQATGAFLFGVSSQQRSGRCA